MRSTHTKFKALDPEGLPERATLEIVLDGERFRKMCISDPDRAGDVHAASQVLSNPIAVFEKVALVAGKQTIEGWIYVGQPREYLTTGENGQTITRDFPSNRQMLVYVDKEREVYNWHRSRPVVADTGELHQQVPGLGRCLFPVGLFG